jgi:GNAT superfamily N-acetyltransferase
LVEIGTGIRPSSDSLNALFRAAWGPDHTDRDFGPILDRALGHVCAHDGAALVGFVNIAWDGGAHAFLLDTCVLPAYRRRGIAAAMVERAITLARTRGLIWLHVDFEPHLEGFYRRSGFRPTQAGLICLAERR